MPCLVIFFCPKDEKTPQHGCIMSAIPINRLMYRTLREECRRRAYKYGIEYGKECFVIYMKGFHFCCQHRVRDNELCIAKFKQEYPSGDHLDLLMWMAGCVHWSFLFGDKFELRGWVAKHRDVVVKAMGVSAFGPCLGGLIQLKTNSLC